MSEEYEIADLTCKSCCRTYDLKTFLWSSNGEDLVPGNAICDICEPWINYAERRRRKLPSWAQQILVVEPHIIEETRMALEEITMGGSDSAWGPRGLNGRVPVHAVLHSNLGPRNDWAWLEVLNWCAGREHPAIDTGYVHVGLREDDDDLGLMTVESISRRLDEIRDEKEHFNAVFDFEFGSIYEESHYIGPHEIIVHDNVVVIDGVPYGESSAALDYHDMWTDIGVLPELLFDSINGLDSRSLDARAELYSVRTQCLDFIMETRNIQMPIAPIVRELVNQLAEGVFGVEASMRFQAALILWSSHPEREFHTSSPEAWAKSFQLVAEVCNELTDIVDVVDMRGIDVTGVSGNVYRISPPNVEATSFDGFEVNVIQSIKKKKQFEILCLHTKLEFEHLPMGDILVSLILMLRDDVESAKTIAPLRVHVA
ncbi:MAG: hypothetical protein VYA86_01645 [Candidatus Thermoplasmatota archaeon]|nr:hypothetical protein [Candidatus Thermoplasmatota archaeon]